MLLPLAAYPSTAGVVMLCQRLPWREIFSFFFFFRNSHHVDGCRRLCHRCCLHARILSPYGPGGDAVCCSGSTAWCRPRSTLVFAIWNWAAAWVARSPLWPPPIPKANLSASTSILHTAAIEKDIAAGGLTNARVITADFGHLPKDLGSFDFIALHGVFSWVAPTVRDTLVALAKKRLALGASCW